MLSFGVVSHMSQKRLYARAECYIIYLVGVSKCQKIENVVPLILPEMENDRERGREKREGTS